MPTIYDPKPRRLWPHTLAIVAAALLLIVVLIWLCTVRGWLGAPECCCCGHIDGVTHKTAALAVLPGTTRTSIDLTLPSNSGFTPGGALNGGHPFGASRRTLLASATSVIQPTSLLSAAPSAFQIVPDTGTGWGIEPVDITGELGDGGDTYVDTWPPPDDAPACQGVCYQIGGTTPTPPVGPPSAVPETASWLDMICGLAVLGCALRLMSALA